MPEGPLWRFVLADLNSATLTFLSRLATERQVNYELNKSAIATGTVPSDNPEINIVHTDGFPFLSDNNRLLYGFRREAVDPANPWVIRYAGLVMNIQDEASTDQPYSHYTAYDPWQYLYSRPIYKDDMTLPIGSHGLPANAGETGDQFIVRLLNNSFAAYNSGDPALPGDPTSPAANFFLDWGQTPYYAGAMETTLPMTNFRLDPGTSLGEAFDQITASGNCDIVLSPIYDPLLRPGYLAEVNVYRQAGIETGVSFQWDEPEYSTAAISRLIDGTQLANVVQYYKRNASGKNLAVNVIGDSTSILTYGQYWAQQFFPSQPSSAPVEGIAAVQLIMRKEGLNTITIDPTPGVASFPFTDYFLGDQVLIETTSALRQATSDFLRVYGIPVTIDDNSVERVTSLLVGRTLESEIISGPITSGNIALSQRLSRYTSTYYYLGRPHA